MAKEIKKEEVSTESLKAKIEELEARLKEGDEGALKRVAKAMGKEAEEILAAEESARKPHESLVEVHMGSHIVTINGNVFRGTVQVPHSTAQVIHQAIGDKRMRHLRELVGKDYLAEEIAGVGLSAKVVGQVNEYGEKI